MQRSLFGQQSPRFDPAFSSVKRTDLGGGAWIEHAPNFLEGHEAVFDALARDTTWRLERREMYDRIVDVPRAFARLPKDGPVPDVVTELERAFTARYQLSLSHLTVALYRSATDSVAMHGDKVRTDQDTTIAIVSLGAPRRFLLRQNEGGQRLTFHLGMGDLLVMGGTCQHTWMHGVPKSQTEGPRMAVMFRNARALRESAPAWRGLNETPSSNITRFTTRAALSSSTT